LLQKNNRSVRAFTVENLGQKIDQMEAQQRTLSLAQQELGRLDTWGHPFLVRGVAGSGKSSVLAYQAAWAVRRQELLHQQLPLFPTDQQPWPKMAVVGLSRTLMPLLQQMIHAAYQEISGQSLAADRISVQALNALLFQLAQEHDFFHYVPATSSRDLEKLGQAYLRQLDALPPARLDALRFDALFIDEGQDLPPELFTLLYTLVRPNPRTKERTLSIFYDDAQNIYGNPRPVWNTFGLNVEGGRAAFMTHCYRNTREILELGLNVLLGSAADENTRVQTRRFADIYTLQEKGLVSETRQGWRVYFATPAEEIPQVRAFSSRAEQNDWIAAAVVQLIEGEQVRPEDVLILAPTATPFPYLEQAIRVLTENRIAPRLIGGKNKPSSDEALILPGQLTLSTIYAAKGYDAPIVLLLDVDQLEKTVTGRSLFYVGVTRAKRYLTVTGVKKPHSLLSEAVSVQHTLFEQGR
jgi:superfamily I DNA and RNA helicase